MARWALWVERALLLGGGALLTFWGLAFLHQKLLAAWDRAALDAPRPAQTIGMPPGDLGRTGALAQQFGVRRAWVDPSGWLSQAIADTSEWSPGRIAAYLAPSLPLNAERLGLLEIPAIDLAVVVLEGTDEWTLNRGVGRIEGTAAPGVAGNAGIAGHRDGFFRGLERVKEGDVVQMTLPGELGRAYRIDWIRVVRPDEVWVLEPTDRPSLTLVTCHPFHFIGNAPDRYVVRAVAHEDLAIVNQDDVLNYRIATTHPER